MLRPVRHLARPLSLCLLLAVGAAQAVGPAQAAAPAGQTATLSVIFGLRDLLVNRDAPNTVRLTTPWGQVSGAVNGPPHLDAKYREYYGRVRPLSLQVRVPPGTRPGLYPASLSARLFTCNQHRGLCIQREAKVPVSLQVVAVGETGQDCPLRLTDASLAPPGRWR